MMNHEKLLKKPIIAKQYRLQWEKVQDRFVLLYPEGVIQLNESAGIILNQCSNDKTVIEIIKILQSEFADGDAFDYENEEYDEVKKSIQEDVLAFLEEAETLKWIVYE